VRLRHIKNAEELVYGIRYIINDKQADAEAVQFLCSNKPLYIEIGMGKGDFIKEAAKKNPDINYIGIEKFASIILKANTKVEKVEYDNLRFLCMDAKDIPKFFSEVKKKGDAADGAGSAAEGRGDAADDKNNDYDGIKVDKIYLNFSDPWPKRKYEQRRLTSRTFLSIYKTILKDGADVEFKTDNKEFFDYSVKSFKDNGWVIEDLNYDIHEIENLKGRLAQEGKTMEEYFATRLMTEYEKKFTKKGNKIGFLRARPGA
jgi:tRNA (guanine-N7-)-methyltransferase